MTDLLLVLAAAVAAVLILVASFMAGRRRGRAGAAQAFCEALDAYLADLDRLLPERYDTDALWARLEAARQLKRQHFPELYPEMLEVSKAHGELTRLLLEEHMERHGAPTGWDPAGAPAARQELQARVEQAVRQLQARCKALAGITQAPARQR